MPLDDLWVAFQDAWILYEDADVIVINKPAGLSTHAPEPDREDDVRSRLLDFMRARGDKEPYLGIHQRLDRDTSGVLLFTKRKEANRSIAEQFEGRSVEKGYVACVAGLRGAPGQSIALKHKIVEGRGGVMQALPPASRGGKEAAARCRFIERSGARALVELRPETGRTHQLRVQLAAVGAPIAGDLQYGGPPAPRLLLHATDLAIRLPGSGERRVFRAAVPAVFNEWLSPRAREAASDLSKGFDGIPTEMIEARMREAAQKRYGLARLRGGAGERGAARTTAFRIVNGGGDGLPGVAVDVYGDHLVVALSSDEALAAREAILDAAMALGPLGVYVKMRPKHASVVVDTRRDDLAPSRAVRGESAPDPLPIFESGLPFEARLGDGLSTGIFLDQRENRRRVREMAAGLSVLNLFAYTGAFSVAARAGGASRTVTVDVSRGALAWAQRNLAAIGGDSPDHGVVEADAIPWLKEAARRGDRFDLVILDPPSFATTKSSRFSAESGYRSLAALALSVLAPGGRLLACTNHRGIVRAKLRRYLHEAAREADRQVAQMKDMPDPIDFPPEPGQEPSMKSVLVTIEGPGERGAPARKAGRAS